MNKRRARAEALQQAGVLVLGQLAKGGFDENLREHYPAADVERIRAQLNVVARELIKQGRLTQVSEERMAERRRKRDRLSQTDRLLNSLRVLEGEYADYSPPPTAEILAIARATRAAREQH